jgi:hypothetical protein
LKQKSPKIEAKQPYTHCTVCAYQALICTDLMARGVDLLIFFLPQVLICTDLMARGIDFKGVNLVINYDFPQTTVLYLSLSLPLSSSLSLSLSSS